LILSDAAEFAELDFPDPAQHGFQRCILGFDSSPPGAALRSIGKLRDAAALSFIEIRDTRLVGLPPPAWRRTFASIISLPASDDELVTAVRLATSARSPGRPADAAFPRSGVGRCRILAADDNGINQKVLTKILQRAGHDVLVVSNGQEALAALSESEHRFDLVIMDVNMPVLNGIEAARACRATPIGHHRIPIIALTADASPQTGERCIAAGMDVCVVKPVEPASLVKIIDTLVSASRAGALRLISPPGRPPGMAPRRVEDRLPPAVDPVMLADLIELGGEEFVAAIVEEFHADALSVVQGIRAAADRGDIEAVRSQAHALQSAAANIGAAPLRDICIPLETISGDRMGDVSDHFAGEIEAELARLVEAIRAHMSGKPDDSER